MKRSRRIALLVLTIAAVSLFIVNQPLSIFSAPSAQGQVNEAWQRAKDLGVYHYNTTVVQTTWPTENLANAGRSSAQQRFYIEGETDRAADMMRMKLWSEGGGVQQGQGALEIKIDRNGWLPPPADKGQSGEFRLLCPLVLLRSRQPRRYHCPYRLSRPIRQRRSQRQYFRYSISPRKKSTTGLTNFEEFCRICPLSLVICHLLLAVHSSKSKGQRTNGKGQMAKDK